MDILQQLKDVIERANELINLAAEQIEEGEIEPMPIYRELYFFDKNTEAARKQFKEYAISEAESYSKQELDNLGWERKNGGSVYNYRHIPNWVKAKSKLTDIESNAKSILSAITNGRDEDLKEYAKSLKCKFEDIGKFAAQATPKADSFYPKSKPKQIDF